MSDSNIFKKSILSAKSATKSELQAKKSEKETERKRIEANHTRIDIEKPRFCIYCGFPLEDDNEFCTECGARIEEETEKAEKETDSVENIIEKKSTQQSLKISADRMASIKETELVKSGNAADEFKKRKKELKKQKTELLSGNYVYKYHKGTMYLSIENIIGSKVSATIKAEYSGGSYAIENYSGTFTDNRLELYLTNAELYSGPRYVIRRSDSFSGTFSDNKISGEFKGQQHKTYSVVFEKI